jgi:hydroxymethylbilane synthase
LALWQARYVEDLMKEKGLSTEIVIIETKGDKILDRSLSKIGSKGLFTQELEDQLLDDSIHIAVHSAKDLSSTMDDRLEIIAFSKREKVNDVIVSHKKLDINSEINLGTSSTRRVAMVKHFFPKAKTVDMRGNLQTRMRKLEEGQADALILAYAGIHRMGYENRIVFELPVDQFTPAVGQGSVAIQSSKSLNSELKNYIRSAVNHEVTEVCLLAERAFLKTLEGGCSVPVFGYAQFVGNNINMTGGVISLDGKHFLKKHKTGNSNNPEEIGTRLALEILSEGGAALLSSIKDSLRK